MRIAKCLLCTAIVASSSAAQALPLPYRQHGEQNIDRHQVGYADVLVNADGSVGIHTTFSNGKQIAGNNFYAVTTFYDAKGIVQAAYVQWKGLDGSWGGHAREGTVDSNFKMSPDKLAKLDHIGFRFGTKNCGFKLTGLHLGGGDQKNEATFSSVECENVPQQGK